VTWRLRGLPAPADADAPIPGAFLSSVTPSGPVGIAVPPQSVTAAERAPATFSVVANGTPPYTYQWRRNGLAIPGATGTNYTLASVTMNDHGAQFSVVISNSFSSVTSSPVALTVTPDLAPPLALSANTIAGTTNVGVCFSDWMDPATATNPANYTLSTGGAVTRATLQSNGQSVVLAVSTYAFTNFTLRLNNLKDLAGNALPANTTVPVNVQPFTMRDIGNPGDPAVPSSVFSCAPGEFEVVAGGSDIWNNADGMNFIYQPALGDFDIQVRVDNYDGGGRWSRAGLMARQNLTPGSPHVNTTMFRPTGGNSYEAHYRGQQGGGTAAWPGGNVYSFPGRGVPVPDAWIRLTRTNDVFTAYASTNGTQWIQFSRITFAMVDPIYVGLATSGQVNDAPGTTTHVSYHSYTGPTGALPPAVLDLQIKTATEGAAAFALDNIYQVFPAGGQIRTAPATTTAPAAFTVKVENDSAGGQSMVVNAIESSEPGWTVTYLWGTNDVSAALRSAAGLTFSNEPSGGAEIIAVNFLPGDRVLGGARKSARLIVQADATGWSQRDALQAVAVNEFVYQPDLLVRRLSDAIYAGGNVFNDTGSNQTKSVRADQGALVVYPLQLLNTGNVTNYFKLRGTAGAAGWTVRYFDAVSGGVEITDDVIDGDSVVALVPSGFWEFRAEVTAGANVPGNASNILFVTATSLANTNRRDTVKMITSTKIATNVPQSRLYTTDADFEDGTLVGTEYGDDQITLSDRAVVPPFIWVPNSDVGTVSKVDIRTGREIGRYRTCPSNINGQPSRTTVDQYGNCWVANRNSGTVVKIGLYENGQYVDRNGNGTIETSRDVNGDGDITGSELLAWGDDECVLWEIVTIPGKEGTWVPGSYLLGYVDAYWNPGPRGIAVDQEGNVWAGTHDTMKYYYLDNATAQILRTNDTAPVNHTAYGAVIDAQGLLWSSGYKESGQNNVLRFDPAAGTNFAINFEFHTYGIGIDRSNHLFVSGYQESKLARLNVLTGARDWTVNAGYQSRGVAVTDDGDVWVVCSSEGNVWRFSNDGAFKTKVAVGNTPTGVSVDSEGKVWVVNWGDEYIRRIDPATDAIITTKRIVGGKHYGYSDMTGSISRNTTARYGTWTITHDSRLEFTPWGLLTWHGDEPANNSITVRARSSNNQMDWSNWETASNGVPLTATPPGQFLQVEVALRALIGGDLPVLYDLFVEPVAQRTADVAVTQTLAPGPSPSEFQVLGVVTVTNLGPQDARGVVLTNQLPAPVRLVSATASQGTWSQNAGVIRAELGNIAAGANATLTFVGEVNAAGALTNVATVKHYEIDVAPANNVSVLVDLPYTNTCVPAPDGLVDWWPAEGDALDLVGTNHGAMQGPVTFTTGRAGLAFTFDADTDRVTMPYHSNFNLALPGFTAEFWMKATNNQPHPTFYAVVDKSHGFVDSTGWAFQGSPASGALSFFIGAGGGGTGNFIGVASTNSLLDGRWHHVAGVWDGGFIRLYVDGVLHGSIAFTTPANNARSLNLGYAWGNNNPQRFFRGRVDELSLYNRALTATEIRSIYEAAFAGKCRLEPRPFLAIEQVAPNTVQLSWPGSAGSFRLESTDALGGAWQDVIGTPQLTNGRYVLTVPTSGETRFFRLQKP